MQQLVDNVRNVTNNSLKYLMYFEPSIFNLADKYCEGYTGGYWDGKQVGEQWIALFPGKEDVHMVNPDNFTDVTVNPVTAGAIITVLALNNLLWKAHHNVAPADVLNKLNTLWEKTQDAVYDHGKALGIDLNAFARFLD